MKMDELISLLKAEEGVRDKPYQCSEGYTTIGVGRNLDVVGLSDDEINYLLTNDLRRAIEGAKRLIPNFLDLSDQRQHALTSMVFQMGESGVSKFRNMILAIEVGDFDAAGREMQDSKWYRQTPERAERAIKMMVDE